MKNKFVKEFIVPAVVLTVLCLIVSAALVVTYNTTLPVIEAAKIAESNAARAVVLSGADKFEEVKTTVVDVTEAYKATNGAGYVITSKSKGYGGDLYVMTGIKADGTIDKVKLMDNNETPGLGSQVGETGYTSRYTGKGPADLDGIDAISGSTVSSYAFRYAVKLAYEAYAELAGVTLEEPKTPEQILFPDVESFEEITVEGTVKAMKAGDLGIILVTEADGYSGAPSKMQVHTAFGPDGKILGVIMGENTETAGIGTQVNEESYTSQYVGKENVDGITAISGATESSDGFKAAVKKAFEAYQSFAGATAPEADAEASSAVETNPDSSESAAPVDGASVSSAS